MRRQTMPIVSPDQLHQGGIYYVRWWDDVLCTGGWKVMVYADLELTRRRRGYRRVLNTIWYMAGINILVRWIDVREIRPATRRERDQFVKDGG